MRGRRTITLLALSALVALRRRAAGAAGARVGLKRIGQLRPPVYVTGPPRAPKLIFVVEQPGRIDVIRHGRQLRRPFLDIRSLVSFDFGERGLLSIALPPGYPREALLRLLHEQPGQHPGRRVQARQRGPAPGAALAAQGDRDPAPGPRQPQRRPAPVRPGRSSTSAPATAAAAAIPRDNAQDPARAARQAAAHQPAQPPGRRRYTVPRPNPFVGRRGRDEIFAYGLRNPYRFSFDRAAPAARGSRSATSGRATSRRSTTRRWRGARAPTSAGTHWEGFGLYRGDWSGTARPGGPTKPILTYGHGRGCSIIGGYVVRDRRLRALRGRYVYADYCNGTPAQPLAPLRRRAAAIARWASRCRSPPRSARTAAAGST